MPGYSAVKPNKNRAFQIFLLKLKVITLILTSSIELSFQQRIVYKLLRWWHNQTTLMHLVLFACYSIHGLYSMYSYQYRLGTDPRLGQGIHLRHAEHIAYVYEIDILSANGAVHILIGGQTVLICNAWSNPIVLNTDQLCSLLFADIIQKFP